MKFFSKTVVGEPSSPLMIRWVLFRCEAFGIYVHKFLRSDHERALHDHPWPFVAIILKGGYREEHDQTIDGRPIIEWRWPGQILLRPAEWRHRIILSPGTTSWSLCLVGRRCRRWGFFTSRGWCHWRRYNAALGICEDRILHAGGDD